jgi:hypothetical protein
MQRVTLEFTVPAAQRTVVDHELDILVWQLGPLLEWLDRHGGGFRLTVSDVQHFPRSVEIQSNACPNTRSCVEKHSPQCGACLTGHSTP